MISERDKEFDKLTDEQRTTILEILLKNLEDHRYSYVAGTLLISLDKFQVGLHVKDIFSLKTYFDIDLQYLVSKSYVNFRESTGSFYPQALKNMEIYESMPQQEILAYSEL